MDKKESANLGTHKDLDKNNKKSKSNTLIYLGIIVVIALVVYITLSSLSSGKVSINVLLSAPNSTHLYPLNTTKFILQVNNTGSSYIKNLDVGFYLGNGTLSVYNVSLPPGKGARIPINYTYGVAGIYNFKAIADPGSVFNFTNNSVKSSNVLIIVNQPESPSKILEFPNGNVISAYNFSFMGSAFPLIAAQTSYYNVSKMNAIFSVDPSVEHVLVGDLYGFIYSSIGTYVKYENGSSAESMLLSGTGPAPIYRIMSSFGFNSIKENNTDVFSISNGIISCLSYNNGWTELSIYNGISSCYTNSPLNVSYIFNKSVFNKYNITYYAQGFRYLNSTDLGALYGFDNASNYWYNVFNISNGFFVSGISSSENTVVKNSKCLGIISNTTAVCSIYISPSKTLTSQFGVIKSTELTKNYNFTIYSFVNNTQLIDASYNAEHLIAALNSTEKPILWMNAVNNTCTFSNTNAISCNVMNFSYATNQGTLSITNNLNYSIKLTNGSCYMAGLEYSNLLNTTISSHASNTIKLSCKNILVPIISGESSYILSFTYQNATVNHNVTGTLNVSNIV
ncbi:MAG: hypothetical protein M1385_01330 [Candidatus Marsarchaeota archaeon]|nr:hypothetical protein [Candidatus Marsarchaeota archaeon]